MEFRRSRLEHRESQELAGRSYLASVQTRASAADAKQHSLSEMALRGQPLRGVDSSHWSCVAAAKFSLRSKCQRPQPCTDRIAVSPAISSTVRHNTGCPAPC